MHVLQRIESIRGREHAATVELIEALVDCHRTRAHVDAGYRSIFQLLVERLHYSRAAASRRHGAMRCALHGSFVIDMLREHRTSLTALAKIAAVLDDVDDAEALLRSIDGFAPEEVDAVVAAMRPIARPVERVRPVAVAATERTSARETLWGSSASESRADGSRLGRQAEGSSAGRQAGESSAMPQAECSTVEHHPTSTIADPTQMGTDCGSSASELTTIEQTPTRFEPRVALSFSLTRDAHTALERVRTRLSRSRSKPLTLEETINALVARDEERATKTRGTHASNHGTTRELEPTHSSRSRHVPASTRRLVFERDGHRCTYVAPDGTRCTATHDLQLDHIHPYALGGSADADNLRVLCGAHNRRRAEITFGSRAR